MSAVTFCNPLGDPQTEAAIHAAGIDFDGYPTFVARCAGIAPEDAFLMICYDRDGVEVRILHVTLHVSLRRAIELVTRERVAKAIGVAHDTLRRIGIAQPRIAVSGLNPHAGEGGLFGSEESEIVLPAMADARAPVDPAKRRRDQKLPSVDPIRITATSAASELTMPAMEAR